MRKRRSPWSSVARSWRRPLRSRSCSRRRSGAADADRRGRRGRRRRVLLNYAWRLLLIPIGLLGSIFSVAAYPAIVQRLQAGGTTSYQSVTRIVRPVVLMSVLVGIWLWINSASAVAAVYGPAGLDDVELSDVANGVRVGAVAVPLITIGAAATSVAFGLKLARLGLIPYLPRPSCSRSSVSAWAPRVARPG